MTFNEELELKVKYIESVIEKYSPQGEKYANTVINAMNYSLMGGGKRLRPLLMFETYRLFGGEDDVIEPFMAAIEKIHTYSLVHDDLPCMDDDDYRRGKESCHKKFGEAYAVLAGDALLTYAFQIASDAGVDDHTIVKCTRALANYAGIYGMVGGQTLDLANEESSDVTVERLAETDKLKTGALIRCACELGCNAAKANNAQYEAAKAYAENLGIAFQIVDDILDVTGDETTLGKAVGSDETNGKATYVTLLGLDGAKAKAKELTNKALEALETFENNENIVYLTKQLLQRNK